jgi:hypothetical protein
LGYQPVQEDTVNPIIATSILAQHQRELIATAEHYRRVRRIRGSARVPRTRKASTDGSVRGHPHVNFQAWLAAGRL